MKKILVLGALSLFGLGSSVSAMEDRWMSAASNSQKQELVTIQVQENENDKWKTIPLEQLKADGFYGFRLKRLSRKDVIVPLIILCYSKTITPTNTVLNGVILDPVQQYLYSLLSAGIKELHFESCHIDDRNLPSFIRVIENNQSLEYVEFWSNTVNITTKGVLDLCDALKTLPVLGKVYISTNIRNSAPTVVDTLYKLTNARDHMLHSLKGYIRTNDKVDATNYEKYKEEVEQLTENINKEIAAARARLPQE